MKKIPLVTDQFYHIYSRSIAGYHVFNSICEFERMRETLAFYRLNNCKSMIILHGLPQETKQLVHIIAYCLMPTHIHLILKQVETDGISRFLNRALNSYTRYFNEKNKRKGPLWEGRFKRILIEENAYFLHLTRYIHLNPVTARMVDSPEEWEFSSFKEYVGKRDGGGFCEGKELIDMSQEEYSEFVKSRIDDQRSLADIKHLLIDE